MVNDDNLADECLCDRWWVVRVTHDLASPYLILSYAADVEPNVVSRFCFGHSYVVCLDRLALADLPGRHENHFVSVLQHSRLDPSHRDSPDSGYGVDVLDGNSQWLVERLSRWNIASNASSMLRPLYHGVLALFFVRLSLNHPLVGTKLILETS